VVSTPEPNLAAGMGRLNQLYAQWFNRRHDRIGHLFCERYWSQMIETDEQLLTVLRYVDQNPVRAGICGRPEQWRWSSAAAMAGRSPTPGFLDVAGYRSLVRQYQM
jgi:hypothetical protein